MCVCALLCACLYVQEGNWLDARTRALFIDVSFYNAGLDQFAHLRLAMEQLVRATLRRKCVCLTLAAHASVYVTGVVAVFLLDMGHTLVRSAGASAGSVTAHRPAKPAVLSTRPLTRAHTHSAAHLPHLLLSCRVDTQNAYASALPLCTHTCATAADGSGGDEL
jgi:Polycystin cation channel